MSCHVIVVFMARSSQGVSCARSQEQAHELHHRYVPHIDASMVQLTMHCVRLTVEVNCPCTLQEPATVVVAIVTWKVYRSSLMSLSVMHACSAGVKCSCSKLLRRCDHTGFG